MVKEANVPYVETYQRSKQKNKDEKKIPPENLFDFKEKMLELFQRQGCNKNFHQDLPDSHLSTPPCMQIWLWQKKKNPKCMEPWHKDWSKHHILSYVNKYIHVIQNLNMRHDDAVIE